MNLDAIIWVLLPAFVAAGSALLSYFIMQARMEVAVAKERESLAEANAIINSNKISFEERIRATEENARRKALDEFMQEFRVEERHYFRENRSATAQTKSMVLQERLFFRNVPLSNWVEHEMVVEDAVLHAAPHAGIDAPQLTDGRAAFGGMKAVGPETAPPRALHQAPVIPPRGVSRLA